MNRRELLGAVGALGASVAMGAGQANADGHGHGAMSDDKMMAPVGNHHLHFCGIHCAKKDPRIQIVTQHYCGGVGDGMHQCLLYDSSAKNARLLGVEYIISDEAFRGLPDVEKKYWHPHTYEVLAGGLIAPGMKPDDEMTFMKALLTTWGKTWHTWPDPTTPIPMGEPLLMWSLTGDGQDDPKVIAARDEEFGVKTAEIRKKRIQGIGYDVPAVPAPKDIDVIGRQWTASGEDKPTKV
ncbi:DUF1264 domain-containing protein [Planctomicrobium piriforme]|uniref:DUF1264 domain-containing protein n=1 Tax=Planctomicrobium piriforme TaxID=1576369 RepID=A0A1I3B985_9PLAN|nr:DUF1264 domain-containing protein [Planctomicrobium piriforme]SFH58251.1 Protein of unknown function [Planctomicrobium piriforme]